MQSLRNGCTIINFLIKKIEKHIQKTKETCDKIEIKHTFLERAASMKSNNSIILCENDQIVNDPKEVTEIFNNFFCECSNGYMR